MTFPENLAYDKSHEWLAIDDRIGTIGITDYAQSELGDIVFVDITATAGDELDAGEAFGTIEAVKTVSDLFMPVTGRIVEVNTGIADAPDSVNNDPYGKGWMVRIEIAGDTSHLMSAADYKASIGR